MGKVVAQNNDLTIVIGGLVTIIGGFWAIARIMLTQAARDREADRKERDKDRQERRELAIAIKDMADSSKEVATAATKSAEEAEQRNGHLASLVAQGTEVGKKNLQVTEKLEKALSKVEKRKK